MSQQLVEIDGSYLEGGGQILRNALSLSCILGRPVRIYSIRANRPNPGLNHQHLKCLNLLQEITQAEVKGNFLKSTEVCFTPGLIQDGSYTAIAPTAASITLMMQCAIPVLAFAKKLSVLVLGGGTNVKMAPQLEYAVEVFQRLQYKFGLTYNFDLQTRGYYPRGGGRITFEVEPVKQLQAVQLNEFGNVKIINGACFAAGGLTLEDARKMQTVASNMLFKSTPETDILAYKESKDIARHNGLGTVLWCSTSTDCILGSDALGERNSQPRQLGLNAAKRLLYYINNKVCVDEHAQDQLILYMALAKGTSVIKTCKLTNHTLTAINVVKSMTLATFDIIENSDTDVTIICQGIGHLNKNLREYGLS